MWRNQRSRNNAGNPANNGATMMESGSRMVGTQAKAAEHMQKNRENFNYPRDYRFVTPIEHSLLYSMIDEGPAVYPEAVVLSHIDEEDYSVYLPMVAIETTSAASRQPSFQDSTKGGETRNKTPPPPPANDDDDNRDDDHDRFSYAQLSAILALSIEKYPPNEKDEENSISKKLCKRILSYVVRHAKEHDLDRQQEISELLQPVEAHSTKRSAKAELKQILPFYMGYAATIITANPIPMMVGWSVMASGNQKAEKEVKNMNSITKETNRRSDVEKTSLLDEPDDF